MIPLFFCTEFYLSSSIIHVTSRLSLNNRMVPPKLHLIWLPSRMPAVLNPAALFDTVNSRKVNAAVSWLKRLCSSCQETADTLSSHLY